MLWQILFNKTNRFAGNQNSLFLSIGGSGEETWDEEDCGGITGKRETRSRYVLYTVHFPVPTTDDDPIHTETQNYYYYFLNWWLACCCCCWAVDRRNIMQILMLRCYVAPSASHKRPPYNVHTTRTGLGGADGSRHSKRYGKGADTITTTRKPHDCCYKHRQ